MRKEHGTQPILTLVGRATRTILCVCCTAACEFRWYLLGTGVRSPGAMPGQGSSDPTSPRREASLFNLPGLRARHFSFHADRSSVEPLVLQVLVQVGDELRVAIEQLGRHPLACPEHALAGLAPARMWYLRVYVGPEAVLRGLQRLPEAHRTLVREGEFHDRLDRLEPVFPRRRQTQRRAVLRR